MNRWHDEYNKAEGAILQYEQLLRRATGGRSRGQQPYDGTKTLKFIVEHLDKAHKAIKGSTFKNDPQIEDMLKQMLDLAEMQRETPMDTAIHQWATARSLKNFTARVWDAQIGRLAHRVVARYLEATRPVEAFCFMGFVKYHPIAKKVEKAKSIILKATASCERFSGIIRNSFRYHGDQTKARPNADKMGTVLTVLRATAEDMLRDTKVYLEELDKAGTQGRSYDELRKSWARLQEVVWDPNLEHEYRELHTLEPSFLPSVASGLASKARSIGQLVEQIAGHVGYLAKLPVEYPKADASVSPEERFRTYLTPGLVNLAKAAAKKLSNHRAACAVLGGDVMEDVNAHSERSSIMGFLKPYYDELAKPENEELYEKVQALVGKVAHAMDWDIIQAGAFCVAMLKLAGAPEAERVIDTLSKEYAPLFKE